jgi:hypothetical protein
MPNDSVGEITDLEEEEIMQKFYEETITKAEKNKKDRKRAWDRLLGDNKCSCRGFCIPENCKTRGVRPKSA